MAFSFGFSGDDIEEPSSSAPQPSTSQSIAQPRASAFPIAGKELLQPKAHSLKSILSLLPSKIAYSTLSVQLSSDEVINLPRRELWDVRAQLMAEDDIGQEANEGLGDHDVKTGIYEGGFKSWESSVDLVKVLFGEKIVQTHAHIGALELGCGTALPSLAMFIWLMRTCPKRPGTFILADYNPQVIELVTVPNLILAWALEHATTTPVTEAFNASDGELELTPEVLEAFTQFLDESDIHLHILSGAWSQEFVDLVTPIYASLSSDYSAKMILLGAETIYSPFALQAFAQTVFSLLEWDLATFPAREEGGSVFVAAKRHYFGVGGSLDDFLTEAHGKNALVTPLREEAEGVRRGVIKCALQKPRLPAD